MPLRFSLTFIYYLRYVLCLLYPMFPVFLDCPFVIAPSVFSNLYHPRRLYLLFFSLLSTRYYPNHLFDFVLQSHPYHLSFRITISYHQSDFVFYLLSVSCVAMHNNLLSVSSM